MDRHPFGKMFDPVLTGDPGSSGPEVSFTVDDVVRSIRATHEVSAPRSTRRWAAAGGALVIVATVVALGASAYPGDTTPRLAASAPAAAAAAATARPAASQPSISAGLGPARRSLPVMIVMPADQDAIAGSSIAVAGYVRTRPHGSRARSVHVELSLGGRVIAATDIDVVSGRFAGVLRFQVPATTTQAELSITSMAHSLSERTVESITIYGAGPTPHA